MASYFTKVLENSYWNNTGKHQELLGIKFNELIPASGKCDSVEGEMLRAICKLNYEYYNNRNINNVSGPALFLINKAKEFKLDILSELADIYKESNLGTYTENNLEIQVNKTMDVILEFIASRADLTPNTTDMWDLGEPDCELSEDPYFDEDY